MYLHNCDAARVNFCRMEAILRIFRFAFLAYLLNKCLNLCTNKNVLFVDLKQYLVVQIKMKGPMYSFNELRLVYFIVTSSTASVL